jgi:DNA-3-methyladenine glycosylase I
MANRCQWSGDDPLYQKYHDTEWGAPSYDDQTLFEFLILEGAQAGLSWITVLRKRAAYRKLFDNFEPKKIAHYSDKKLDKILLDPSIIRNRLKIYSVRQNSKAFLTLKKEESSFANYIWDFVDGKPIQNHCKTLKQVPAATPLSNKISKELKRRGFNFIGPTIIYAFMQAIGMVNDHIVGCFRHEECKRLSAN